MPFFHSESADSPLKDGSAADRHEFIVYRRLFRFTNEHLWAYVLMGDFSDFVTEYRLLDDERLG